MKKKKWVTALLMTTLLLTGCSEHDKLVEEANRLYISGDNVGAFEQFSKANRIEKLGAEDYDIFYNIQTQLYGEYNNLGNQETQNLKYEEALTYYEAAKTIYAGDQGLLDTIASTKNLIQKQKVFDEYIVFYEDILNTSNATLDELNREVDALFVGAVSDKSFSLKVKGLLSESNEIVSKLDDSFSTLEDEGIVNIHQELINVIQYQHQTLQYALHYDTSFESGLDGLSERLIEVKRKKTAIHQALKLYGKENALLFTFNQIKKQESEEKIETSQEKVSAPPGTDSATD